MAGGGRWLAGGGRWLAGSGRWLMGVMLGSYSQGRGDGGGTKSRRDELVGECYGVRVSDGPSVSAMGKHAVNRNLVPRLGRSRSITRLSPPNYTDPTGAPKEMIALIFQSGRWARRGECKVSSESSLKRKRSLFYFLLVSTPIRPPRPWHQAIKNTSQFLPARIHFSFRLASLTILTSTEIIHGLAMNLRSLSSSLNPIPCCKVVPAGVVEYTISRRKILTVLTPGYKISGTT